MRKQDKAGFVGTQWLLKMAIMLTAIAAPANLDRVLAAEQSAAGSVSADDEAAIRRARRHPSYQVLAAQKKLPPITADGDRTIRVGDSITITFNFPEGLRPEDKTTLAKELEVPETLLEKTHQRLSETKPSDGNFSASFQTAIIDFHYLRDRWDRYSPTGSDTVKKEAVGLLRKGELEKPWLMYLALPKPAPPGGGGPSAQTP